MRKSVLILVAHLFFFIGGARAQETSATPPAEVSENNRLKNQTDEKIYQMALRYNDINVAKAKLYDLMERNPRNLRYAELLASLYFEMEQYTSSALVAMDMLEIDDKNISALEIAAYSLEQVGALERALPHFESLHLLSGDLFSLYKTSYLQYTLKKYDEAMNSVNMLIKNNKVGEQNLTFPTESNQSQEVSMLAAALNLKGLIYKDQGSNNEAKAAFEEALQKSPDFELAKTNLASL
ncbi:tetratricopeptide repeat protein [Lunatimonas salinarum]|uniref:tetratricopeptide repeat protein n=1 Tax=Lunatimonas salinarum TaxID=1774590 RepID=UPI001AE01867|nr:tetratricopeptide repeat protein [Lunatimonas salinarum]